MLIVGTMLFAALSGYTAYRLGCYAHERFERD